jgi:hypothetical protein
MDFLWIDWKSFSEKAHFSEKDFKSELQVFSKNPSGKSSIQEYPIINFPVHSARATPSNILLSTKICKHFSFPFS